MVLDTRTKQERYPSAMPSSKPDRIMTQSQIPIKDIDPSIPSKKCSTGQKDSVNIVISNHNILNNTDDNMTNSSEIPQKKSNSNKSEYGDKILQSLMDDPTRSDSEIAQDLNTYRQKVWRRRKELEEENDIWGYTAVVDESKLNHVSYIVLMKTRTMNKELVDILIKRITLEEPRKQGVRLKNMFYVNGEFDWVIRFTAPDHATARKYFETLRLQYADHLQEKPVMIDINFSLVLEGKHNPDLNELHDFVP